MVAGTLLALAAWHLEPWLARWRQLRLNQAMAAVRAASTLYHGRCSALADRRCEQLLFDGQPIEGAHGHPAASNAGIARLAGLQGINVQWREGSRMGLPTLTVYVDTPSGVACEFTYVQAPVQGAAPGIDNTRASCD